MEKESNIKIGSRTEKNIITDCFRGNNYWAYLTPLKINGQPIDIIAIKKNNSILCDAKHVNSKKISFSFSDIQPNQIDSLNYAHEFAGLDDEKNLGFGIYFEKIDEIKWLSLKKYNDFISEDKKSVRYEELINIKEIL